MKNALRYIFTATVLFTGVARADAWINVSSTIHEGPQTITSVTVDANGNTILKAIDADSFEGTFSGVFAEFFTATIHSNGTMDFILDFVFDGTAAGATGTVHLRGEGHGANGTATGTWEIIKGTGRAGLTNAKGGGTWSVNLVTGVGQLNGQMKVSGN